MDDVQFLAWDELLTIHRDSLEKYGGQDGFLDEGAVLSAFHRPGWRAKYQPDADLADLASDYLFGLATTQGFCDGNKRTALGAAAVFLRKNGWTIDVPDDEMYPVVLQVATGGMTCHALADWLRENLSPL